MLVAEDEFGNSSEEEETVVKAKPTARSKRKGNGKQRSRTPSASKRSTSKGSAGDYDGLTVVKLKAILRARGLKVSGKKQELIDRITDSQ